jgi:hypothetical protein
METVGVSLPQIGAQRLAGIPGIPRAEIQGPATMKKTTDIIDDVSDVTGLIESILCFKGEENWWLKSIEKSESRLTSLTRLAVKGSDPASNA